jgi:hypothetical protein
MKISICVYGERERERSQGHRETDLLEVILINQNTQGAQKTNPAENQQPIE